MNLNYVYIYIYIIYIYAPRRQYSPTWCSTPQPVARCNTLQTEENIRKYTPLGIEVAWYCQLDMRSPPLFQMKSINLMKLESPWRQSILKEESHMPSLQCYYWASHTCTNFLDTGNCPKKYLDATCREASHSASLENTLGNFNPFRSFEQWNQIPCDIP